MFVGILQIKVCYDGHICCLNGDFIFREDLFCYHRACHSHVNPLKCAFCHFEAQSPFDFNSHFFRHTVQFPNKTSFQLKTSPPVLETFD